MAALSIRDLDESVKERLRLRAAQHGRSMEAEVRSILADAVADQTTGRGLAQALIARFGHAGGVELELPGRTTPPRAADVAG